METKTSSPFVITQLSLGLALKESATFAGFFAGPNLEAVRAIQQTANGEGEQLVYLWGGHGSGKTHLLQAACHQAGERAQGTAYLPMAQLEQLPVDVLEGLEALPLVCIDDVHLIAGREEWEFALFDLFNRVHDSGGHLVISACAKPADAGLRLPDLRSRFGWGVGFQLHELDDAGRLGALQLQAGRRGLELTGEVGLYLLRRYARDMSTLMGLLDQLDRASLAAQRRLTIPFIKSVLSAPPPENGRTASPPQTE